ncbi:MAG: aldo/keto reductase [Thermoanaerobaculia bacterium]|nr:aldo/keto reductase [Thermoanaerobaculia bacterium]
MGDVIRELGKRPLGDTGLEVSRLALGTVKFGRTEGLRYPRGFTIPEMGQLDQLLGLAADLGVNLLDTAPAYGDSEHKLGRLLASRRDQFMICTKVGEEFENGRSTFDFSPAHTRRSVERSLRRLRRDVLDIVLVHSDGRDEEIARTSGALETLDELRQAGTIRAYGMSTKAPSGARLALERTGVAMIAWNLDDDSHADVLEEARERGKGVLIKKALASGHRPDLDQAMGTIFQRFNPATVVIGTIDPEHLKANAAGVVRAVGR